MVKNQVCRVAHQSFLPAPAKRIFIQISTSGLQQKPVKTLQPGGDTQSGSPAEPGVHLDKMVISFIIQKKLNNGMAVNVQFPGQSSACLFQLWFLKGR